MKRNPTSDFSLNYQWAQTGSRKVTFYRYKVRVLMCWITKEQAETGDPQEAREMLPRHRLHSPSPPHSSENNKLIGLLLRSATTAYYNRHIWPLHTEMRLCSPTTCTSTHYNNMTNTTISDIGTQNGLQQKQVVSSCVWPSKSNQSKILKCAWYSQKSSTQC